MSSASTLTLVVCILACGVALIACSGGRDVTGEQQVAGAQTSQQASQQEGVRQDTEEEAQPAAATQQIEQTSASELEQPIWSGNLSDLPIAGSGSTNNISWLAEVDGIDKSWTIFVSARGESSGIFDGVLFIGCEEVIVPGTGGQKATRPVVVLADIPYVRGDLRGTTMQYVVDGGEGRAIRITFSNAADGGRQARITVPINGLNGVTSFIEHLRDASRLAVRLPVYEQVFNGRFDIAGLFNTPIQPNIDHCGSY